MQAPDQERVMTELDHARLLGLMTRIAASGPPYGTAEAAEELLDSALTVPAESIDPDVVTMRSRIRLRGSDGQDQDLTLAYPDEADGPAGRISVLSPLGLSLVGCRAGQDVHWRGPNGVPHQATLVEILYQPEAAGDYGT